MRNTFITGATGFLGGHLIRRLLARGDRIRALVRPQTGCDQFKELPIEVIKGDLKDAALIRQATEGCEEVYHAAADYRLWCRDPREMYASNVQGTRNIMQAAWECGVRKVIYTSTVGTVGIPDDGRPGDERLFMKVDSSTGHYKKSKFQAEEVALEYATKGLPVVIVNPSAPVGSHDWKPTPTGRMIVDFLNRRMPMYLNTGLNLVDAGDVADGHLLAAQFGRVGERYILGNENLTLKQILDILSDISGIPAPTMRCPYAVALMAGWWSEMLTRMTGSREPRVPLEGVRMARKYMFFASDKARKELGFQPEPARVALERAVKWFLQNGYVHSPLPPERETAILTPDTEGQPVIATR